MMMGWTILPIACVNHLSLYQMDVKNAFLLTNLKEIVYRK